MPSFAIIQLPNFDSSLIALWREVFNFYSRKSLFGLCFSLIAKVNYLEKPLFPSLVIYLGLDS